MALHAHRPLHFHSNLPSSTITITSSPLKLRLSAGPPTFTLTFPPIGISPLRSRWRRSIPVPTVVEESQESSEPEAEAVSEPEEQEPPVAESELASELKKAMQERKDKEGEDFWGGVAQEIREIEWPPFGKVLGTTGVVLSVIFGSSVVLLTVNAVLAELSDKIFAGKGVQDFFGWVEN